MNSETETKQTVAMIVEDLKKQSNSNNVEGMKRFGINTATALGINIPFLRNYAKQFKGQHALALQLWQTNIHEARLLAIFIDNPKLVTVQQMETWVHDINSWDLCDQACNNLFRKTPWTYNKITEWANKTEEFVKRAAFVLIATLAVHDKKADNKLFLAYFDLLKKACTDERNFVKKAVNWAIRQIGKRNLDLKNACIKLCEEIIAENPHSKPAKWIAQNALLELNNPKIIAQIERKNKSNH